MASLSADSLVEEEPFIAGEPDGGPRRSIDQVRVCAEGSAVCQLLSVTVCLQPLVPGLNVWLHGDFEEAGKADVSSLLKHSGALLQDNLPYCQGSTNTLPSESKLARTPSIGNVRTTRHRQLPTSGWVVITDSTKPLPSSALQFCLSHEVPVVTLEWLFDSLFHFKVQPGKPACICLHLPAYLPACARVEWPSQWWSTRRRIEALRSFTTLPREV